MLEALKYNKHIGKLSTLCCFGCFVINSYATGDCFVINSYATGDCFVINSYATGDCFVKIPRTDIIQVYVDKLANA